jgi:hypothetical protein
MYIIYKGEKMEKKMSLFEIDAQVEALLLQASEYAEANNGEYPEDLDAKIEELSGNRDIKRENYIKIIKNLECFAENLRNESDSLKKRAISKERLIDRLKNNLSISCKGEKFECVSGKISWRKSERVKLIDSSTLPDEYFKVTKEISYSNIKSGILQGFVSPKQAVLEERLNVQVQ